MHFYLLVKMSVTLPSPSVLLSPSPSPNGNINSRRDSEEPWHVSTLFDSFCFWLTEIGNKQRPSQVLSVGTYLSNIFALNCMYLCCFSWYVFLWPWRRRNVGYTLQLACNLVSYYICNKMSPCMEIGTSLCASSFATLGRRLTLGIIIIGQRHAWEFVQMGLEEVKCVCKKVAFEFIKRTNWENRLPSCKLVFRGECKFWQKDCYSRFSGWLPYFTWIYTVLSWASRANAARWLSLREAHKWHSVSTVICSKVWLSIYELAGLELGNCGGVFVSW